MRFRKDFDPIVLNMCYDGHAKRSCAPLKANGYLRRTGVFMLKNSQFIFESLKRRIYVDKGQLISKGLFGIFNSPKNRMKKIEFTTMIPQVDLFSFIFWEKLKTPKRHFEIN